MSAVSAVLALIVVVAAIVAALTSGRSRWSAIVLCVLALVALVAASGLSGIAAARSAGRPLLAVGIGVAIAAGILLIGYVAVGSQAESTSFGTVTRNAAIGAAVVAAGLGVLWVVE